MKRALLIVAAGWAALAAGCGGSAVRSHVETLAGEPYEGRGIGTEGAKAAADYIAEAMEDLDLTVSRQEFETKWGTGINVVGVLPGALEECVVVGAHYDHLGKQGEWIHYGADDNASGVAVMLELASRFVDRRTRRTLVFVAFSGEEKGLFGSLHYVKNPVVPLDKTVAMVNLDMVGRLREKLLVLGTESGDAFKSFLADSPVPIAYGQPGAAVASSDHVSFQMKGVPAVHLFTNLHEDYHKATDTADKINYEGMEQVLEVAETLVRRISDAPRRVRYKKVEVADPHAGAQGSGGGMPYFGSMPDYAFEGKGVRLAGVTPGSPAAQAGLAEGDVIVSFGGRPVANVQDYTEALRSKKAGDEVAVDYERGGEKKTTKATLVARKKTTEE